MPGMDWLPLSIINATAGTITLPFWAADLVTAVLLILLLLAVYRAGFAAVMWTALRIGLVAVSIVGAWALLGRLAERDRAEERHGLERRMQELAARATAPGSVLGCVDVSAGEEFEKSCERAIFSSAESVAAATDYVAAKLALLADAVDYVDRGDPGYAPTIAAFRRPLETDRFGLVAQVLAQREGCTADKCGRLKLLSDSARVTVHLKEASFDGLVTRYSQGWSQGVQGSKPTPDAPAPQAAIAPSAPAVPPVPRVGITYPSAASIPAVSIMSNEPDSGPSAPAPKRTEPTSPQHHSSREAHPRPGETSTARAPAAPASQAAPAQPQPPSQSQPSSQ